MSTPNIFTLPRECRDLIYNYLTHDIVLDWGYRMYPFPLGGHSAVQIRVPNAPILSALLSCTQIYDEYTQTCHLKNPSMSINLSERCMWRLMEGEPTNQARVFKIMKSIAHVEFSMDSTTSNDTVWSGTLPKLWMLAETLMQPIRVFAPKLRSVKMALQLPVPFDQHDTKVEADVRVDLKAAESSWFHQLPPVIAGRFVLDGRQTGLQLGEVVKSQKIPSPRQSLWSTKDTEDESILLLKAEWCLPTIEKMFFT